MKFVLAHTDTHKHVGDSLWIIWSCDNAGSVLVIKIDDKVLVKWRNFFKVWELDYRINHIEIVVCNTWSAHVKDEERIGHHAVEVKEEILKSQNI